MTLTPAQTAHADQLAATLRDRRDHDGHRCDALFPCDRCLAQRRAVQTARALARVPEQRKASE